MRIVMRTDLNDVAPPGTPRRAEPNTAITGAAAISGTAGGDAQVDTATRKRTPGAHDRRPSADGAANAPAGTPRRTQSGERRQRAAAAAAPTTLDAPASAPRL